MSKHLQNEIDRLHGKLLTLCANVETNVILAARAVETRDAALARQVIASDPRVDEMEVELEEDGLKILALHQPVAVDLRVIVASIKINRDLERIGDLAVNIAKRAAALADHPPLPNPPDFQGMVQGATGMLSEALDALVQLDAGMAQRVCRRDDEVDAIERAIRRKIVAAMEQAGTGVEALLHLLFVARHLERIADHATNIAEDVLYILTGNIVRHRHDDAGKPAPG